MNCRNCGTELPNGAMFCGECGATVTVPRLVEPATRPRPGDTVTIQPIAPPPRADSPARPTPPAWGRVDPVAVEPAPVERTRVEPSSVEHVAGPEPIPEPVEETVDEAPPAAVVVPVAEAAPAPVVAPGTPPVVDRSPAPAPAPAPAPSLSLAMPPATGHRDAAGPPASTPAPATAAAHDDHDDVEATRIVRGRQGGDRFVLQFSTGENAIVFGTGLIGRNPVLEPGEFVDQLIPIVDPGKSVSKTHLEFGQDEGRFWVSDRFSANGTVVRQPDAAPQRLEPGRRHRVVRGTRIDIAEQFFVVS